MDCLKTRRVSLRVITGEKNMQLRAEELNAKFCKVKRTKKIHIKYNNSNGI